MTGLGFAIALLLLLLWCSLLYASFRWRPIGIYLIAAVTPGANDSDLGSSGKPDHARETRTRYRSSDALRDA